MTALPLVMYNSPSTSEVGAISSNFEMVKRLYGEHRSDFLRHKGMLSTISPDVSAHPLLFIKTSPSGRQSGGSSTGVPSQAASVKYAELAAQLETMEVDDQVERGAVRTAADVVQRLSDMKLAPPELSWMGSEAVVMLWVLGLTKYALTVTEGEVGYVVRAEGRTIRRDHSIALNDLDFLRLS